MNKEDFATTSTSQESSKNIVLNKIFLIGTMVGLVGASLFIGIVLVGLIGYGKVYLYDGYKFTGVLTTISLVLMGLGLAAMATRLVYSIIEKDWSYPATKIKRILVIILAVFCFVFSAVGLVGANKKNNGSSGGSFGGSSGGSSTVSAYLGLELSVTEITTKSSYTYVYCKVKNVSSRYGNATKYRYVKVKAVFKNRSGTILDTDWTYGVDGTWLLPGETKTFYYMVRDVNVYSASLSIIS